MICLKQIFTVASLYLISIVPLLFTGCKDKTWRAEFGERLALFGHRNWIIIADSAYPLQSAPGITTINTGEDHLTVVKYVLQEVENASHVSANILLDAELELVPEKNAPGIDRYKTQLQKLLEGKQQHTMMHEDIIAKLDQTSKLYSVLILKTNMTLPYTTVFLELGCAYWDDQKEQDLQRP